MQGASREEEERLPPKKITNRVTVYSPRSAGERGEKTPYGIVIKPHHPRQIWWPSVWGIGDSGGQISPFSTELHSLTLSSLKQLVLPCWCVICICKCQIVYL